MINCENLRKACERTGIKYPTAYNWLRVDPEFKARYERQRELTRFAIEQTVVDKALGGNLEACKFYLENNWPDKYHKRTHQVITAPTGKEYTQVTTWMDLVNKATCGQFKELKEAQERTELLDSDAEEPSVVVDAWDPLEESEKDRS